MIKVKKSVFPNTITFGFGDYKIAAAFVSVPETAVNKNYGFIFGENNVGFSGEGFYIQPVTESVGKQKLLHEHFGLCVFPFYAAHIVGAGSGVVYVGHRSIKNGKLKIRN